MALPLILAGVQAALTIGGAVANHVSQDKGTRAAEEATRQALRLQRQDLSIRAAEEQQAASQARALAERQATFAQGSARASAASAGVRGASVDAVAGDISGDLARTYDSIDFNLVASLDQIQRARESAEVEAQSRLNGIKAERPSMINTLLRAGGGALDAYSLYKRYSSPPGSGVDKPQPPPIPGRVAPKLAPVGTIPFRPVTL
jgi:hypothetical protein